MGFAPIMPAFALSEVQLDALVAYMKCGGGGCASDAACAGVELCAR